MNSINQLVSKIHHNSKVYSYNKTNGKYNGNNWSHISNRTNNNKQKEQQTHND
jgi:hypothetical protein